MAMPSRFRPFRKRAGGWIAVGLVVLAASAFPAACDRVRAPEGGRKRITVAVTPWPGSASVYIAREKGYFLEEGIEAVFQSHPSGHLGIAALLSGKADFATATETPVVRAVLDGKPLALLATISSSDRAYRIVARGDRGIVTPRDLVGKRIGRIAGTGADFFLDAFLTVSYVDPKNVRIVPLEPDRIEKALLEGEVDAVCSWPPHTTVLKDRLGAGTVVLYEPGVSTMTWNIVTTGELARRDPDAVARFLRAIVRASRFVEERRPEAAAILAKNTGTDVATNMKELEDHDAIVGIDQGLLLIMEDQARWMIAHGISDARRVPNFLDVVSPEGLKAVSPESVDILGGEDGA